MASGARDEFGNSFWRAGSDTSAALPALSPATIDAANFRLLADNLPTLCWMANGDGYIVWYNRRWHDYCGTTPEQMEGWGWQAVHDPELLPSVKERWAASIASGEPFEMTFPLRGRDGVFRPFLTRIQPVRDASGTVARWFGVNTEVSDQHRAEEALRDLNETLEQRVALALSERERVEEQLRQSQKMEAVGRLTGGLAHDFNNLLTIIRSSADLLRRRDVPEDKRRRYIDAISDTADRAATLTRQLLAFARRQPLQPERFDAGEHLRETGNILRSTLGGRIRLQVEVRCEDCLVEADPTQFDTAVLNLVLNARDAMDGEGALTIVVDAVDGIPARRGHAAQTGRYLAVSVTDEGVGIPREEIDSIFEPFFTTKGVGMGTGLGLSQVLGFAKQSGGDIIVQSEPGHGTTFSLYLPHAEALTAELPVEAPVPPSDGSACDTTLAERRILVVEDNQTVGEFAVQLLGELGYQTQLAGEGQAALDLLAEHPDGFDLVFSDVVMPGIGGVELAQRIRRAHPRLPVVLTSGYSHVLAEEGSHGFPLLRKPYAVEGLARILRTALRERLSFQ